MEMLFSCDKCGQQMTIDSQYAGMATTCINCQADVIIPQPPHEDDAPAPPPPQQSQPPPSGNHCPRCRSELTSREAIICMNCGFNLKSGKNIKAKSDKEKKGHPVLALLVALIAAAAVGGIWAGVDIALELKWNLSIFILPLSFATAGSLRLISQELSLRMGLAALLLTFAGIMFSRVIVTEHSLGKFEQDIGQAIFDKNDTETMAELLADSLVEKGELPNPHAQLLELAKANTPLKDEKYNAAYAQMEKISAENKEKIKERVAKLTDQEKEKLLERSKEDLTLLPLYFKMTTSGELKTYDSSDEYDSDNPASFKIAMARDEAVKEDHMKTVREKYRNMTPAEKKKYQGETTEKAVSIFRIVFRAFFLIFSLGIIGIINTIFGLIISWQLATRENLRKARG